MNYSAIKVKIFINRKLTVINYSKLNRNINKRDRYTIVFFSLSAYKNSKFILKLYKIYTYYLIKIFYIILTIQIKNFEIYKNKK